MRAGDLFATIAVWTIFAPDVYLPFLSLSRVPSRRWNSPERASRFYFQSRCLSSRNLPDVSRSPYSLHRVSSTLRSLSSSFRVRSRGNSDDIRSREGLLKPLFRPAFGWKLRETWTKCFSRVISSATSRKISLGVTKTKLFLLSISAYISK